MSRDNEHPEDRMWQDLTGSQRRLVARFMDDLQRSMDLMHSSGLRPVTDPDPDYLSNTYEAGHEDAVKVSDWFAYLRHQNAMEDRVKNILDTQKAPTP